MKKYSIFSSLVIGFGFPLTQLAIILNTPALSAMQQSFGVSMQDILLTISFTLAGYTLGNLFWGTLSDHKVGRRNTMLLGLTLYIMMSFVLPSAESFLMLCILLVLYGFSAATFTSVGNAMLKDMHGQKKVAHVIAYVGIAMATTPMVAPVIGSHLLKYFTWHGIYYFTGILGAIMLIAILTCVPNIPKKISNEQSLREGLKSHLSNKQFLMSVFSLSLTFGAIITSLEMLPIIYTHYLSVKLMSFGYLILAVLLPYPLGSVIASQLIKKWKALSILTLGLCISVISFGLLSILAFNYSREIVILSLLVSSLFFGFGLSLSMLKASAMTSVHHYYGSASSLMKFTQSLGGMVITAINAHLHQSNSISQYAVLMSCVLLLGLILIQFCRGDSNAK